MLSSPNVPSNRCSYFWINILSWCYFSTWRFSHVLMKSSKHSDTCLYSASRILVAEEISSLIVCGSYAVKKTSIRASTDYRIPLSFYGIMSAISIPSDRMVIEVHDYAWFFNQNLVHFQWSYHMCVMTQNSHLHEMPKKNIFVSSDWTLGVKMSQTQFWL
jgi:hypothetical protein